MSRVSSFETRLLFALALLGSAIAHGLVLVVLFAAPALERPVPVSVEITFADDERGHASAEDLALPEEAPPVVSEEPTAPPSAAPLHFRERLRVREAAFDEAQREREQRVVALERWREGQPAQAAEGEPPVAVCGAAGAERAARVLEHKSLGRYAHFAPTGLFPRRYLEDAVQVFSREGGGPPLGRIEIALPAELTLVQLDEPKGAVFALGREDARCLVGMSWGERVFPLTFTRVPARYVDDSDRVVPVLIDVTLGADGRFTLRQRGGEPLAIEGGALYDREAVARNLKGRAAGAQIVRQVFGALFGG